MKALYLLILPALLLGQQATAQSKLQFGVKAGATYSGFHKRNAIGTDQRLLGLNAGVLTRYTFADNHWAFQPELLYAGKGGRFTQFVDASGNRPTYTDRAHYLDLPLLLRYQAGRFAFEAGPQLGIFLSADTDLPAGVFLPANARGRDRFAPVQLGYAAGVSYELPQGLSLTARYAADLSDRYWPGEFGGYRHSVFQAQLGYLLVAKQ
jgi:hypothetical protein